MKALLYTGPKTLEIVDVPKPSPGAGEALLQVLASSICGSDVHGWMGTNGRRTAPMVMGHEFSARVEALGEGVDSLSVGDLVAVQPCWSCFDCDYCKAGKNHICPQKRVLGVFDHNGGMQEYMNVPEQYCFRLPEGMDPRVGALVEAFAVSYAAIKKAGDLRGKNVLIIGGGTIGLLALLAANLQQPKQIAVSDLSAARLDIAETFGATARINPQTENFDARVKEIFGEARADVTIEAVGVEATANQAISATASGGVSVWIGNNQKTITVDMQDIVTREIAIKGTYIYSHEEFGEALELLPKLDLDLFLSHCMEIPLEEAGAMFKALADDPEKCLRSIIMFDENK